MLRAFIIASCLVVGVGVPGCMEQGASVAEAPPGEADEGASGNPKGKIRTRTQGRSPAAKRTLSNN